MTLIKINLEKPALIEERVVEGADAGRTGTTSGRTSGSGRSNRAGGRSLALPGVALLVLAVAAALAGRKLRARRRANTAEPDAESHFAAETESADESGGRRTKAVGLLGGLVTLALVARKLRARNAA